MSNPVLIVDDSLTVRMDLLEAFQAEHIDVEAVDSLAAARARIARGDVGAVVLDLLLPDGIGIDLVRELRADPRTTTLPVLMLSSEAEVHDRIRGIAIGADDYAGKPYEREYVIARVRELLARRIANVEGRQTILVIDDSETFRETLRQELEGRNLLVVIASTGEEGLRMAATHRPDAILVDGQLPGIDGATVVRKLRLDAALRHTPCILITGSSANRSAELVALDAGADAFVRKDDEMDVILARITAVVRSGSSAESGRATPSLLSPKRILVVDERPLTLDALAEMLRGEGYDVIPARSGMDALNLLSVQLVDCILVEHVTTDIDAAETCRRIKASPATRDVPLIMLADTEDRNAMLDGLGAGADDYVLKEGGEVVLRARLKAQLRRKQIEDEARSIRIQLLSKELEATEARAERDLAEARAAHADELAQTNRDLRAANEELESFAYTVSHDLRAPLRGIDGFTIALLEDYGEALAPEGRDYLDRVRTSAARMNQLIEDLLSLSKITRRELQVSEVDLSGLAWRVFARLKEREPGRAVECVVGEGLASMCDARLIEVVLENLMGNAWKFTNKTRGARIEFGRVIAGNDIGAYFIADNGAGFDMTQVKELFGPFHRLHTTEDFEGTGIGLATVKRVISRHGGRAWATGAVDQGATFYFTLGV